MTPDPAGLWTIEQVADHAGIKSASARGALSRAKLRPVGYRPHPESRRAVALYDADEVRAALAGRPGRGARTDRPSKD